MIERILKSTISVLNYVSKVTGRIAWQLEEIQRNKRMLEAEELDNSRRNPNLAGQ